MNPIIIEESRNKYLTRRLKLPAITNDSTLGGYGRDFHRKVLHETQADLKTSTRASGAMGDYIYMDFYENTAYLMRNCSKLHQVDVA